MRYTQGHKEKSRERILQVAAKMLREIGPEAIGVAAVMKKAGLTHGAFYAHFRSREALISAAMQRTIAEMDARVRGRAVAGNPDASLNGLIDIYLSTARRDAPGDACLLPSLCTDAARKKSPARKDFTAAFESVERNIFELLAQAKKPNPRDLARSMLAEMVGAMSLARAVDDKEVSDNILEVSRAALKRRAGLGRPA